MTPKKGEEGREKSFAPNRLVAFHIARLRNERGWTQVELGRRLEPFVGEPWSVAMVSAAERSMSGPRVREFDADLLVAFARVFEVTVGTLLAPNEVLRMKVPDVSEGLTASEVEPFLFGPGEIAIRELRDRLQHNLRTTLKELSHSRLLLPPGSKSQ